MQSCNKEMTHTWLLYHTGAGVIKELDILIRKKLYLGTFISNISAILKFCRFLLTLVSANPSRQSETSPRPLSGRGIQSMRPSYQNFIIQVTAKHAKFYHRHMLIRQQHNEYYATIHSMSWIVICLVNFLNASITVMIQSSGINSPVQKTDLPL